MGILHLYIRMHHQGIKPDSHIKYYYLLSAADGGHISSKLIISAHGKNFNLQFCLLLEYFLSFPLSYR